MSEQRILVTGGCGYIGSALLPRLLEDERVASVVVFDSLVTGSPANLRGCLGDSVTFHRGDICEYSGVETKFEPDLTLREGIRNMTNKPQGVAT